MPIKAIKWGAKHPNILVKLYTYTCIGWFVLVCIIGIDLSLKQISIEFSLSTLFGYVIGVLIGVLILGLIPMAPLYVLFHIRTQVPPLIETKIEAKTFAAEKVLDPYLASAREKFNEVESYFKGEKGISWGPVVVLCFDAVLSTLQRLVIDAKGIKPIEEMRKDRKLYFDSLISLLKGQEGMLQPEELKNLQMLRDLRNRVVHEDYRPTKEHAIWASNVSKAFVSKKYPEIFEHLAD